MWLDDGLNTPEIITQAVEQYRLESDTMGRFIEECCDVTSKIATVKAGTLYQRYKEFCEQGSERWLSSKDFPYELEQRGYCRDKQSVGMLYRGIKLKESATDYRSGRDGY
jgi:phage/plasmid-associated DNA primase